MNYLNEYVKRIGEYKQLTKDEEKTATVDELVLSNLKFVIKVAHEYKQYMELEDLIQEGNKGLVEAANKFDRTRNIKFITYAVFYIRKYMFKCVFDKIFMVKGAWKIKDVYKMQNIHISLYKENNPIERIINKNADDLYNPSKIANDNDTYNSIKLKVSELTDTEKKAIMLRYGMTDGQARTLKEVASEMNCSIANLKSTLNKAHTNLRKQLHYLSQKTA